MKIDVHWLGRRSYSEALALQETLVARRAERTEPPLPGLLLLLEHEAVYTIGRTRDRTSLRGGALPHPVVEINRGGQATYHGPGQLVGYPILDLRHFGQDLHFYLRELEEVLIVALQGLGVEAGRREGLTGVWVGDRKLASIGVGVRRWISMHGFALNVEGPLTGFEAITPCGITGVEMSSVEREAGASPGVRGMGERVAQGFRRAFGAEGNADAPLLDADPVA